MVLFYFKLLTGNAIIIVILVINMREKEEIQEDKKSEINNLYKSGLSLTKISNIIGISRYRCREFLYENGEKIINKQNEVRFDVNEVKRLVSEGVSLTKISKKLGGTRNAMARHLLREGIVVDNIQNISKFNHKVFDCIDNEEKAYWLGFIFADGNISSPRKNNKIQYSFELSLALVDVGHLIKINDFFCHNKVNVKLDNFRCRFYVSNKHLWNTLNSYGCTPVKSLTLEFPDKKIFKSKSLIRHFIRGYFDGDGCLCTDYGKYKKDYISFIGTPVFLKELLNNIPLKKSPKIFKSDGSDKTYILSFYDNSSYDVCKWMYSDSSIYLDRKYKKFKEMKRSSYNRTIII